MILYLNDLKYAGSDLCTIGNKFQSSVGVTKWEICACTVATEVTCCRD